MGIDIAVDLVLGLVVGAALGAVHMVWLWRASSRLGADRGKAVLLLFGGAFLRLAVVLGGFAALLWLAKQPAVALAGALAGFAVIRVLAVRRARKG